MFHIADLQGTPDTESLDTSTLQISFNESEPVQIYLRGFDDSRLINSSGSKMEFQWLERSSGSHRRSTMSNCNLTTTSGPSSLVNGAGKSLYVLTEAL